MGPIHKQFLGGFLHSLTVTLSIFAFLLFLPEVESKLFPVLTDFQITRMNVSETGSVIIRGKVSKDRQCEYIHPWRARTLHTGRTLSVTIEEINVPNWAAGALIDFGIVTIEGANGEPFELYAEHRCGPLGTVISHLAVIRPHM